MADAENDAPRAACNWPRCNSPRTGKCFAWCKCRCHSARDVPAENDGPKLRELTVGQLIDRLQAMPSHHYVSPMVDGVLGAGIDVWQVHDPQTNDTIVVFGESKPQPPVIVPPAWTRPIPPAPTKEPTDDRP